MIPISFVLTAYMSQKIDKDNIDQLTTVANEMFENIEIKEEDFAEQFDNHIAKAPELFSRKEDLLERGSQCSRYEPCPVCYKCRVKGSHIYDRCDSCPIAICTHEDRHIGRFVVRDNFATPMPKEVSDYIKSLESKVYEATGVQKELLK